jgi:DNA polymerase III, epsilon subunit and related 3''-5'' exonucleases
MNVIILDTETTDLQNARLIQLAYKNLATGEVVNELFKPPTAISFGAMATHHITEEMVGDKQSFGDSLHRDKLLEMLNDAVVVAHNAAFDLQVLKNEGVEASTNIDTLRVARHLIKSEQYSLQYLRYALGLNVSGAQAHDALGDILVLEALFNYLKSIAKNKFNLAGDGEMIAKMIELTKLPVMLATLNFGKYKGVAFEDIVIQDKRYLQWLYDSETQKRESEQNEDLVYTIEQYIK